MKNKFINENNIKNAQMIYENSFNYRALGKVDEKGNVTDLEFISFDFTKPNRNLRVYDIGGIK